MQFVSIFQFADLNRQIAPSHNIFYGVIAGITIALVVNYHEESFMPHMIFTSLLILGLSLPLWSRPPLTHVSPDSKVDEYDGKLIKIKTKNNTHIKILLDKSGQIEVVEGVNLNRGDIFIPGQGILPLSIIEKRMLQLGERTYGRWRLIKYQEFGWVYQLNVASPGQSLFHIVNAYSGQLIGSMTKLAPLPIEGQVAKD